MPRFASPIRLATLVALIFGLGAVLTPGTAAQDTFDLPIRKLDCMVEPSDDAVRDFALFGNEAIPANCTVAAGVSFTVADADGTNLGSCTLGADGICTVPVPVPSTVTVTEDVDTAAIGFTPRENPITIEVEPATEASAIFVNLQDVQGLPDTGTGATVANSRPPSGLPPYGVALLALATGIIFGLRGRIAK
ncbi:MAG TPA: hypothetical protein VGR16_11230 [Thermomicrobiales bacterium]|nr:hypothetical protein [Thermomicrobiales bacterium]